MKDYKKLIKDNKEDFTDAEQLTEFIDNYTHSNEPDEIEDYLTEQADSLTPIYYSDQLKRWQETPDCHGLADEQGLLEATKDPLKIMAMDLFAYIYQELSGDYQTFIDLWNDQDDDEDEEPKA